MSGYINHGLAKAMIQGRHEQARRAGERTRVIAEARTAAVRDEQASRARRSTGVARWVLALLRAPAA
jgi:hypothetical protein